MRFAAIISAFFLSLAMSPGWGDEVSLSAQISPSVSITRSICRLLKIKVGAPERLGEGGLAALARPNQGNSRRRFQPVTKLCGYKALQHFL